MDIRQPNPTQAAGILRKFLKESGIELKHTTALEALARMCGFTDWQAMAAAEKKRAALNEDYPPLLQPDPANEDNSDFVYIDNPGNKRVWVSIGNMSLNFGPTHEGVIVDVFAKGAEMGGSLGSMALEYQDALFANLEDRGIDYDDIVAWFERRYGGDFDAQSPARQEELVREFADSGEGTAPDADASEFTGKQFIFDYPAAFTTLPEYTAHSGQTVTVIRQLTAEEADRGEGLELMFLVRAADGWEGHAWESELVAPGSAPLRFVFGQWEHIFHRRPVMVRFVFDREEQAIIFMEIRNGHRWEAASREDIAHVQDSLLNANDDALDDPAGWGLTESSEPPVWAR